MAIKGFVSLVVIGTFLMFGSVTPPTAIAPVWSYKIENMTGFAMSKNGEYLIVACEKGPNCKEGQFYVFDRYGNILKDCCIESEITAVDIANNGIFFLGIPNGYYFSSALGEIPENPKEMEGIPKFVSMSKTGEIAVVRTDKGILICDRGNIKEEEPISDESTITAPAVSDDGSIIVCGISTSIMILDSQLTKQETWTIQGKVTSIAMTADGSRLVYGTQEGRVFCLDLSRTLIWEYPKESSEESSEEKVIREVPISSEGRLTAVLSENITSNKSSIALFDSSGRKLRELEFSKTITHIQLSQFGEILSYSLDDELIFLELYQRGYVLTHEYMLPSKKGTLEHDQLIPACSYSGASLQSAIVADINGDGRNEVICSFPKEVVVLNKEEVVENSEKKVQWKVLWEKSFDFKIQIAAMDVTFNFIPEVIVTSKDNHMRFLVFDGNGKKLASEELYLQWYSELPSEDNPIRIHALWSGDIDNDGLIEIVCRVSATYLLEPRGICVFEYPLFKKEWYYPSAPYVETVNIVDLDNDGNIEIICGSYAPCNGRKVKNTDDSHAYVSAINLQGETLWIKEIGSGFKGVYIAVADFDGNGTYEVVCGGWSHKENWGELFVLDDQGNYVDNIDKVSLDYPVFLKGVSDLDSDGDMEVLVSDEEKALAVYDHNLHLVRKSNVGVSAHSIVTVNDLDGDGQKEIVAISHDDKIVILNSQLEEEWSASFSGHPLKAAIVVNLSGCKNDLFILADKLYLYSYKDQSQQPCALPLTSLEMDLTSLEMEIKKHIDKGDDYFEKGDYLKAIEEYDLAIEKLQQTDDTGTLANVTRRRTEAYEYYNSKILEADQLFKEGIYFLESEDFQKAGETFSKAREIYDSLGKRDEVQKINELLPDVAYQLSEEGKTFKESEDFQKAGKTLLRAREIYDSLGKRDEVQKINELLPDVAYQLSEEGKTFKESEDFQKAGETLLRAREIYDSLGKRDEVQKINELLLDVAYQLSEEGKTFKESEDFQKAGETFSKAREIYDSLGKRDEVQKINELLLDVAYQLFKEGKTFKESEDFQKAEETFSKAREIYDSLGKFDEVQEIDELLLDVAYQLFKEGIYFLELEDFQKAEETFSKAREIYDSQGKFDEVQKMDDILSEIKQPLQAQKLIAEGKEKESQNKHEEAIYYYKKASQIYEELGNKEKKEEVQMMIEQAEKRAAMIRINAWILRIAFAVSLAVATFSYLPHREYEGENKEYGFTLMTLIVVLVISHIAVSLSPWYITFLVTVSMCILFLMVLYTYLRRS